MVQRNISVTVGLEAANYLNGLDRIQKKTRETAKDAQVAFGLTQQQLDKVGRGAAIAAVGFTAATGAMIKAAAEFQGKLSQVSALGGEYEQNIGRLSKAAFTAGKAFGLSASQVADAQIELAKAGVSASDILGGALPGALALASAGQIDVGKATAIASTAMTQFGKAGSAVPHIADLIAASADKSVGSVESVGDALNQAGLVASQFGLSVEDTVGTLTSFSKAGLNGSDAGTSFKTMLLSLASPSKQAQEALEKYNITAYDAQGNFVGITNLAEQLQAGFHGVDQASRDAALSTIFGTDAVRAANVLYKQGADVTQGFADSQDVAGFAALSASKKLDNLNGDLQKLGASLQNDLIGAGTAGQGVLRGVTQSATNLLDVFGALPAPIQGTALGVTAVGAAVTAAGAAFLLLTPKIVAARAAMAELNITGKGLAVGLGKGAAIGLGITALTSGLANLGSQGETTAAQLNLAAKGVKTDYAGIDKLFASGGFFTGLYDARSALGELTKPLGAGNGAKFLDGLTLGITHFSDVYKTAEGQFKAFGEQFGFLAATDYSAATGAFGQFVGNLGGGTDAVKQALQVMPAYKNALVQLLTASGQAATEQNLLAAATGQGGVATKIRDAQAAATANENALKAMSGAAVGATGDIDALADTIAGFGSVTLDARAAQRDFEAAVDAAAAAVKDNGRNLDVSTEAGRANQDALDGIASSATRAAGAILKSGGSAADAADAVRAGRRAFIDAATSMGLSRAAAKRLADQLNLIPSNVKTSVGLTGVDAALTGIRATKEAIETLNGRTARVAVIYAATGKELATGGVRFNAAGGAIDGPGPKGKDSILSWLAPGEHVLTDKDVDRMGGQANVYAFRRQLRGYATGGAIGDAKSDAAAAERRADELQRKIIAGKKQLAVAQKAAAAADRAVERASDASSAIYGKGTGQAKHDAAQKARQLRKDADAAGKTVDRIEKQLDALRQDRDDEREKAAAATERTQSLQQGREDFVSTQRRATPDSPIDPLSYVDQLRAMSRDGDYSDQRRAQFKTAANDYEASLVRQQTALSKATEKVDGLTAAADSMRSSITSAIASGYQLANVPKTGAREESTRTVQAGTIVRNGIRLQAYDTVKVAASAGAVTAASIDAYYRSGKADSGSFAADLKRLAGQGVNGALLAEIAGYGVEQGAPIAKALLSATSGQIRSINSSYTAIQANAATAARTVTDVNYKALIDSAQKNADKIAGQIAADGDKLRKLIAKAFGLTGYAVGTMNATPGWHVVGEQGPELLRMRGGEQVQTATKTRTMLTSSRATAAPVIVQMPDTITVADAAGFTATMRVIADRVVTARHEDLAVRLMGAAG